MVFEVGVLIVSASYIRTPDWALGTAWNFKDVRADLALHLLRRHPVIRRHAIRPLTTFLHQLSRLRICRFFETIDTNYFFILKQTVAALGGRKGKRMASSPA